MMEFIRRPVSIAPLVTLRIVFGSLMVFSTLRFWYYGWIDEFYLKSDFHFSYFGWDWIQPLPGIGMYLIFALMAISALGMTLGLFYRVSAILFFLCFSYIELIDKTFYLNHYYLVSIMAFLLILLPAHRRLSLDVKRRADLYLEKVPFWIVAIPKLQLSIVYFFAGVAKLHADWLLHALPLKLWLGGKTSTPLIGPLFKYEITSYIFSWFGAIYDLFIPVLLWVKKYSVLGFGLVIVFHTLTWILFPIGVFPWVMIGCSSIFLPERIHDNIIAHLEGFFRVVPQATIAEFRSSGILSTLFLIHFGLQLLIPMRQFLYKGDVRWHEQGFRFSWRVMVVEKNGSVNFRIRDKRSGAEGIVLPSDYLRPLQEKQMSFQPDMILQLAHHIAEEYSLKNIDIEIYADSKLSFNGREHRTYIDPSVDLCTVKNDYKPRYWLMPYE